MNAQLHSQFSASGSSTWLNCPGSIRMSSSVPHTTSVYAEEGIFAHALAYHCLINNTPPASFSGRSCGRFKVTEEVALNVSLYIDFLKAIPGKHSYEQRVRFSDYAPDGYGTADCIIVDGDTLHIVDLKYGKGIMVYARNNSQLQLYALGALQERPHSGHKIRTIKLTIAQPRRNHFDTWTIPILELRRFGSRVKLAVKAAEQSPDMRIGGHTQCQWCKARSICPEAYVPGSEDLFENLEGGATI